MSNNSLKKQPNLYDIISHWLLQAPSLCEVDERCLGIHCVRSLFQDLTRPFFIIVPNQSIAEQVQSEIQHWLNGLSQQMPIHLLPEVADRRRFLPDNEAHRNRIIHLIRTHPNNSPLIIITTPNALFAIAINDITQTEMSITKGMAIAPHSLTQKLVLMDYDDELEVNVPGEFSIHGGIIDLFSPSQEFPARLEFWGDQIDSIRLFNPQTQHSIKQISEYQLIPRSSIGAQEGFDILDCLNKSNPWNVIIYAPEKCQQQITHYGLAQWDSRWKQLLNNQISSIHPPITFYLDSIDSEKKFSATDCISILDTLSNLPQETNFNNTTITRTLLNSWVQQWLNEGGKLFITVPNKGSINTIKKWCNEQKISDQKFTIILSNIPSGLIIKSENLAILTEREIFFTPHQRLKQTPLIQQKQQLSERSSSTIPDHYMELDEGDYAVHLLHGIALFHGIRTAHSHGISEEFLELEFADQLILHVPIWQTAFVSRYAGPSKMAPKLSKIGGKKWTTMKHDAILAMKHLALNLLKLQATRNAVSALPFPADNEDQKNFENAFPFQETKDQLTAIDAIKKDMQSTRPMDRLLCGDVGFGKTEVAVRAAFKAVSSGRQVVLLAPTTILAQQHYYTFAERFANFPYTIDLISRFRSNSDVQKILFNLASGGLDIVIGTHRLLNPDIQFAKLGLVIIDEEQRFGVEHKEILKRLKNEVDVLSLSATPIPRTLYMSMTGLRDLSTLSVAPEFRLPVHTIVSKYDDGLITDAIQKEICRGGQVFYLHNRVQSIHSTCEKLRKMMPTVSFAVAHGQMKSEELESVMINFLEGHTNVLVCTTIIESGIDIPNANTIIIERADRLGLSELYQLRGRVGRWIRQAYAYFLIPSHESISLEAKERMAAIRKFTQLGAGFRIAMRDLEIRGSGNLLGAEQSGHIINLGFDLYCKLLKITVSRIQNQPIPITPDAEIQLPFLRFAYKTPPTLLPAAIPPDYIPAIKQRIEFYRQLSQVQSIQDIHEIKKSFLDRYGPCPHAVQNFLTVTQIRLLAACCGFRKVSVIQDRLALEIATDKHWTTTSDGLPKMQGDSPYHKLQFIVSFLQSLCKKINKNI